jgi:hypothetical protein
VKVHSPDSLSVTAATTTNDDNTLVISAARFPFGDSKEKYGWSFVQVWIERTPEVANTGCDEIVRFEEGGCAS